MLKEMLVEAKKQEVLPTISVVIPTRNSEKTLPRCLESIARQDYPKERIEVIIVDGGSKDKTLEIAKDFEVNKIVHNPLRTGEAGKAAGIRVARNEIVAFIDSDNILPVTNWFKIMVTPFSDPEIVASEPLYYSYQKMDPLVTRYCSLIGMNDPLCLFLGNYDRYSLLTDKWTELDVKQEDKGRYLEIKLRKGAIPTIGANGFLIWREILNRCSTGNYLFDVDVVWELVERGYDKFAKVKIGIIHIFSSDISTFIRKQIRRIRDYTYYENLKLRRYAWSSVEKRKVLKFVCYSICIFPLLIQSAKGYAKKPDTAWFFHIPACWTTLVIYGIESRKQSQLKLGYLSIY